MRLNSYPLVPLFIDPRDLGALIPAHFVIGEPLIQLPDVNMSSNRILSLSCRSKLIAEARTSSGRGGQKTICQHYHFVINGNKGSRIPRKANLYF